MSVRLLGLSGALRRGSTNTLLAREALRVFRQLAPGTETEIGDLRMPLYDGDLEDEHGLPPEAQALIGRIRAADGVVISTPEYNKNLPGVLKNALDWVSRERPMALTGKPVAILSAAAGRAGGERSQFSLRHCLTPFNPRVLQGPEVMIADSRNAFDDAGRLKDERGAKMLRQLMETLRDEIELAKRA
ncbi:MAG: NADPH-dependent FMN reductase [Pseudomonadota bacterium]